MVVPRQLLFGFWPRHTPSPRDNREYLALLRASEHALRALPKPPFFDPLHSYRKDSDLESIDSALFSRASGYFPQAEGRRRRDASPGQAPKALPQMFIILAARMAIRGDEQVINLESHEMVRQALEFREQFGDYPGLNIKVPIGWNELAVIRELKKAGVRVNCTCCMSLNQAVMAAGAGADFVSLFYGRIRDIGYDAFSVVQRTQQVFREAGISSEIIVGSIRHIHDVNDALLAGADIRHRAAQILSPDG